MMLTDRSTRRLLAIAGVFGFCGVALGAFGAHALSEIFERSGRMDTWETAVFYHLVHAVALLALAMAGGRGEILGVVARRWIARCWITGIGIFSGSLYLLCLTGLTWLGAITPIGGLFLLAGWFLLVLSAWFRRA